MGKWQQIQKRDLDYILRNEIRKPIQGVVLNEAVAYALDEDIDRPSYETANGWHFYSYLSVSQDLQKAEDNRLTTRLVRIYDDYTNAAKAATALMPDNKVTLLEHQGVLLHFYLDYGRNDTASVISFAKTLALTVKNEIFKDKEDGVRGFKMAAEFGQSIILKMPSASGESAAHSRISLGPSANDPAKKLLGNTPPASWHFVYRESDDAKRWEDVDCTPPQTQPIHIALDEAVESHVFAKNASIEKVPDNPPESPAIYYGFVFRADMDGFTSRVKQTFEKGDESAIEKLALDFINFMADVNDWQQNFIPHNKVIVFPWAGDCCNMITYPVDETDTNEKRLVEKSLSDFPTLMIKSWCDYLASKNRQEKMNCWTYGMASGSIKIFSVSVDQVPYRLMVGWPVGISQEGVNLDGTNPDDLIMHRDDVNAMADYAKNSFTVINPDKGYKRQDKKSRQKAVIDQVSQSAHAPIYHGFSTPKSKPYFPEPM